MPSIAIIGGGITGLTAAYALKKGGYRVRVFEKGTRPGGLVQSERKAGFLVEHGPQSLLAKTAELGEFLDEIGLADERLAPTPAAKKRYIVKDSDLLPLPSSPADLFTNKVFSTRGKLRALMEPFIRANREPAEESLAAFVERRLGREILDYAVDPFVSGIYAGNARQLSASHSFPMLVEMERKHGSLFKGGIRRKKKRPIPGPRLFSFKEGLGTVPRRLAALLREELMLNANVEQVTHVKRWNVGWRCGPERAHETFDKVLLCAPAHCLPPIEDSSFARLPLEPLRELPYSPVSILALGFHRDHVLHPLDGFGALIPSGQNLPMLGIGFASSSFANRAPEGRVLIYVYVGGAHRPDLGVASTDEILAAINPELTSLLGIVGRPCLVQHISRPRAIPQYNLGHGRYLDLLERAEQANQGLYFSGNYRNGISVGDCIQSGVEAARRILEANPS